MNILHVVDLISQQSAGGSAKVPYQLGQAQAKLGHNVTIYASDYQAGGQDPPVNVTLQKFHCVLNLLGGVRITPSMIRADFHQFDIIHLHNYRTLVNIIAANRGVPYVLQAHGSAAPIRGITKPIHDLMWRSLIFKRAGAYIADAEKEIGHYVAEGAEQSRVTIIPVGIDFNEFANPSARQINSKKRVLFLGRMHEIKAPDLLARAFKLLNYSDATLLVSGIDYGYDAAFKQQVKELGIASKVEYLGPCYGSDKTTAYTNADVYVMPSRYEMFGLTLLESLACGTPVIITDRCGIAPLLPPECGLVVPFDEQALAQAIRKVLDDRLADKYRRYRMEWARQYDWRRIAPKTIEVYKAILEERTRGLH